MNNPELMLILAFGCGLMCVMISVQMKWYGISMWKSVIVSLALVFTGLFGSRIWYFVENGNYGGRSFYGAVFFAPLVFFAVAKLFRIPYLQALDFCAPAGSLTLALVKIQCLRDKCCQGKILYIDENQEYVRFPSQMVEMIAFVIICIILFLLSSRKIMRGKIFPCFLVLYGASRFVLNFFRYIESTYAFGLSAGSFWSLISFCIGMFWLILSFTIFFKKGDTFSSKEGKCFN